MPVLILFLLLEAYTDITAHLYKHYQEEHMEAPVRYLSFFLEKGDKT